ncbi:MAG: IS1634 family transposase [Candidatus Parcubacteria bacterium]|nr:IS1634 family transposase [Candidatus Parcubacteria bacterium]
MFIRQKKNKSGSVSVQIISKHSGKYKLHRTIGSASSPEGIEILMHQASHELSRIQGQSSLFPSQTDANIEGFLNTLSNSQIQVIGPELVFGKIYDAIGFNAVGVDLFRHLVIARLAFPLSKLKTIDYLYRFQGVQLNINSIYRFLDKLNRELKEQVQQIAYRHTLQLLNNKISIVFYDMTTLYFEASDEDDLRKTGFSKDGKHQNPQIYLGLLVTVQGYVIGYEIFEGNIFEGHTLIPVIQKMSQKFNLSNPIVVADAGLLSKANISGLEQQKYEYILGAKIKTEGWIVKNQILSAHLSDGELIVLDKGNCKLIVTYASNRAAKDAHNRKRGLQRLEKQIKSGKLTKAQINNKGYNKYLAMKGNVSIEIDYEKYEQDGWWDGMKGYITNCRLKPAEIVENYKHLWQIEKAFRMSKTDLRIRPIYHRIGDRIEAHICISFAAYAIYKDLERVLYKEKSTLSVKKAAEQTQNMYQIIATLPESKKQTKILLKMNEEQSHILKIMAKYY